MKKVVVGMSGGVDSSVAALLLKEQGYEVVGLFMKNWDETDEFGCCTAEADFCDVRAVSDTLSIPYYTINFTKEYWERVFSHFVNEYKRGRTPNPDVLCNREIKFDAFSDFAKKLGADYVATGHYCRLKELDGKNYLLRAKDENKCQTYFLNQLENRQLDNVLFPVGELVKGEVRRIAAEHNIPTAEKKDSTGVCFIGERNFRKFLAVYIPMKQGKMLTLDGKEVGTHNGVYYYTVGQRHGLGIGGADEGNGEPWFVVGKDVEKNVLYVNQGENCAQLFSTSLDTENINWIADNPFACGKKTVKMWARYRHRQPLQEVEITETAHGIHAEFSVPQRAVNGGQYFVLYGSLATAQSGEDEESEGKAEVCLGGGVIA